MLNRVFYQIFLAFCLLTPITVSGNSSLSQVLIEEQRDLTELKSNATVPTVFWNPSTHKRTTQLSTVFQFHTLGIGFLDELATYSRQEILDRQSSREDVQTRQKYFDLIDRYKIDHGIYFGELDSKKGFWTSFKKEQPVVGSCFFIGDWNDENTPVCYGTIPLQGQIFPAWIVFDSWEGLEVKTKTKPNSVFPTDAIGFHGNLTSLIREEVLFYGGRQLFVLFVDLIEPLQILKKDFVVQKQQNYIPVMIKK
jgi:hypothetical protein